MAKGDWWFKFEFSKWRNDPALRKCSLETKGFWIDCLCVMREAGEAQIEGTYAELARLLGCLPEEVARCIIELERTKTADVTKCNDVVTVKSRRFEKELSTKEHTRLRVQEHRRNANVTEMYADRVRSKSKSKSKEKEKKEEEKTADADSPQPAKTRQPRKPQTFEEIVAEQSADPLYTGIDVPREGQKAAKWIKDHPGRKFTKRFFVNWLNGVDPAVEVSTVNTVQSVNVTLTQKNDFTNWQAPEIKRGAPFNPMEKKTEFSN